MWFEDNDRINTPFIDATSSFQLLSDVQNAFREINFT